MSKTEKPASSFFFKCFNFQKLASSFQQPAERHLRRGRPNWSWPSSSACWSPLRPPLYSGTACYSSPLLGISNRFWIVRSPIPASRTVCERKSHASPKKRFKNANWITTTHFRYESCVSTRETYDFNNREYSQENQSMISLRNEKIMELSMSKTEICCEINIHYLYILAYLYATKYGCNLCWQRIWERERERNVFFFFGKLEDFIKIE